MGWFFKTRAKTAPKPSALEPLQGASAEDVAVTRARSIDIALQHHRVGRLSEAEAAYGEVLAVDPENIDALHFLGVIAYQRGEHGRAEELISRALSRNASNAPAYSNLGNATSRRWRFSPNMPTPWSTSVLPSGQKASWTKRCSAINTPCR